MGPQIFEREHDMFSARKSRHLLGEKTERAVLGERIRDLLYGMFNPASRKKETVTVEVYCCEKVGEKLVHTDVFLRGSGETESSGDITFRAAVGDRRKTALRKLRALGITAVDHSLKVKAGCPGECLTYTYQLRQDELDAMRERSSPVVRIRPRIVREPAHA